MILTVMMPYSLVNR